MKLNRKKCCFIIFILFSVIIFFSLNGCKIDPKLHEQYTRPGLNPEVKSIIEDYQNGIAKQMKINKVPGLSIAIVDREGILWSAAFGYTDYDKKKPVTQETIFSIQSMSKTFTATAVMLAVQDGLVDLDTPLSQYLPDFKINSRFEERPQDIMTIRHMLTHTAGFTHEAPVGNNYDCRCTSFEEHVNSISKTWLRCPVGQKWYYSNLGIDLATYIIQERAGKPITEYMKEKIFDPFKMSDSSVDLEFIAKHPNRAIGHTEHFKNLGLIPMLGAGGVYTNANDLANYIKFFLNNGKVNDQVILSKSSLELLFTPTSIKKDMGIGFGIPIKDGKITVGHSGGGFGFTSNMGWYPEYGIGGLILKNSTNNIDLSNILETLIQKKLIAKQYEFKMASPWSPKVDNAVLPEHKFPVPDEFTPYKREWKKYIGTYKYKWGGLDFHTYADIALALGYPAPGVNIKVYEKNGFLEIDGQRLDEYKPGVFFTNEGECLDFRNDQVLWRGVKMK